MSNFITIPGQADENGIRATHEIVINLDQIFLFKKDDTIKFGIRFLTPNKEGFTVSFLHNIEERDLWYEKIKMLITNTL